MRTGERAPFGNARDGDRKCKKWYTASKPDHFIALPPDTDTAPYDMAPGWDFWFSQRTHVDVMQVTKAECKCDLSFDTKDEILVYELNSTFDHNPEGWTDAYHGTQPYSMMNMAIGGPLASDDKAAGHGHLTINGVPLPGFYTAPLVKKAFEYATPMRMFDQSRFHRVVVECLVNPEKRITTVRRVGDNKQLVHAEDGVMIKRFIIHTNAPPLDGDYRFPKWDPLLEAIPDYGEIPLRIAFDHGDYVGLTQEEWDARHRIMPATPKSSSRPKKWVGQQPPAGVRCPRCSVHMETLTDVFRCVDCEFDMPRQPHIRTVGSGSDSASAGGTNIHGSESEVIDLASSPTERGGFGTDWGYDKCPLDCDAPDNQCRWQYEEHDHSWTDFSKNMQEVISDAFFAWKAEITVDAETKKGRKEGWKYLIKVFKPNQYQLNLSTGKVRKIKFDWKYDPDAPKSAEPPVDLHYHVKPMPEDESRGESQCVPAWKKLRTLEMLPGSFTGSPTMQPGSAGEGDEKCDWYCQVPVMTMEGVTNQCGKHSWWKCGEKQNHKGLHSCGHHGTAVETAASTGWGKVIDPRDSSKDIWLNAD